MAEDEVIKRSGWRNEVDFDDMVLKMTTLLRRRVEPRKTREME